MFFSIPDSSKIGGAAIPPLRVPVTERTECMGHLSSAFLFALLLEESGYGGSSAYRAFCFLQLNGNGSYESFIYIIQLYMH